MAHPRNGFQKASIVNGTPKGTPNGVLNGTAENRSVIPPATTDANIIGSKDISKGKYSIRQLYKQAPKEDGEPWYSPALDSNFLCVASAVHILLWFAYLYLETSYVLELGKSTGQSTWRVWTAMLAEFSVYLPDVFISLEIVIPHLCRFANPIEPTHYELLGDIAPTVDVMILCCGEDADLIMHTVVAAAAQDYPTDRYRIFVLDDAKDSDLKALVQSFASGNSKGGRPFVGYIARDKPEGVRHYFKAGNLRNGAEESARLAPGSEYLAALDADMIVSTDWLRRLIPHLIVQDDLALACPPQVLCSRHAALSLTDQHFYNIPADDPFTQDSYTYARISEPLKRQVGGSSCGGSGYIIRRAALPGIGGLPLVDVGEDIMLSTLLHASEWQTTFVEAEIQHGLAPDTYGSYIKQRMRWVGQSPQKVVVERGIADLAPERRDYANGQILFVLCHPIAPIEAPVSRRPDLGTHPFHFKGKLCPHHHRSTGSSHISLEHCPRAISTFGSKHRTLTTALLSRALCLWQNL